MISTNFIDGEPNVSLHLLILIDESDKRWAVITLSLFVFVFIHFSGYFLVEIPLQCI